MIKVLLFAGAKERLGQSEVTIPATGPSTVAQLREQLTQQYPQLQSILKQSRIAFNNDFVAEDSLVPDGAEIAVIPPVSGG